MKPYAEILKYAEQYEANKPYHLRSKKSKNPDDYFRRHESELLLYDGAKNMLQSCRKRYFRYGKEIAKHQPVSRFAAIRETARTKQKPTATLVIKIWQIK